MKRKKQTKQSINHLSKLIGKEFVVTHNKKKKVMKCIAVEKEGVLTLAHEGVTICVENKRAKLVG